MFTNKTTKEPLKIIKHPEEAWQDVSIDLFGPMPDKKHIVVVQDMNTRFPAAKVVPSTGGDHVISAIDNIYADFGSPDTHRTDNGPPFNSQQFSDFSQLHAIEHHKVFPYHPQANPVETLMKPLGKAMKIAHFNHQNKQKALNGFLSSYRLIPHPSTGEAPGDLLFRGGYQGRF